MFLDQRFLQDACFHFRREHALAAWQWNFSIEESQVLVSGRHEVFALDHDQHVENILVKYIPWAYLLFDHVETGFFEVHVRGSLYKD